MAFQFVMPSVRSFLSVIPIQNKGLLEVAVSEAITNAIRASSKQSIHFSLLFDSMILKVRIMDHGQGFNVKNEVAKIAAWGKNIPEDLLLSESGKGLWIIYQVFDYIQFNTKGNKIILIKNIN